jgi:hypothetical protein
VYDPEKDDTEGLKMAKVAVSILSASNMQTQDLILHLLRRVDLLDSRVAELERKNSAYPGVRLNGEL